MIFELVWFGVCFALLLAALVVRRRWRRVAKAIAYGVEYANRKEVKECIKLIIQRDPKAAKMLHRLIKEEIEPEVKRFDERLGSKILEDD